ncbi:uncharacterized protein LOC131878306 isoform X2 [Tigriopus californicus]|uniref:uncharacterized protein LOC131878306 isoform X2 n=1 Tax=Tigriopus californicus TaxID=6832 RepID=UPI0027DA4669|nr:uncharacterized protein LOC131878306 isoform X2 [Tigriopus californicus]
MSTTFFKPYFHKFPLNEYLFFAYDSLRHARYVCQFYTFSVPLSLFGVSRLPLCVLICLYHLVLLIPSFMQNDYSYQGRVELVSNYMDDSHGQTHSLVWTKDNVDKERTQFREDRMRGSYGNAIVKILAENARNHLNISGSHVLVIGSQTPWLEAMLLEVGAKKVTTLEYVKIRSEVPEIDIITPMEMGKAFLAGELPEFDAVVTFSSIEHSGLGRYGDGLNPFADLITMARTWCVTKKGGRALVGVPTGPDQVLFNAAKVYGPLQYSHLFANWKQIHSTADYSKYSQQCRYCYQPVHIIEKQ